MKILIADDDPQILRALRITLIARGYDVVFARDGGEAINKAIEHKPNLFMIDLGMPHLDGIEVITAVRGWSSAPILVVSGRTDSADKVAALDAGADDYVTKPFAIDELLARVRALVRRSHPDQAESAPVIDVGHVKIDLSAKTIVRSASNSQGASSDLPIRLTPTEWKILEILVRHSGKLVTRQTLLSEIWGTDRATDSGYLRLYMSQLRKKLELDPAHPQLFVTEPGMGYRFVPQHVMTHDEGA
ncbi:response regulator [Timonella sp. A28]|uniref:response regulator n=1 Tax=Timonella sp. A28 TaxID=3442640 RepID=UPI003EBABCE1